MKSQMLLLGALLAGCAGGAGSGDADFDGDGVTDEVDCAPSDPLVFPGGLEVCANGLDDDCDDAIDGDDRDCWVAVGEAGVDDDGDGLSESEGDCNDGSAVVYPGAPERCDGLDNNCDGLIDEDCDEVVDPQPFGVELVRMTLTNGTGVDLVNGIAGALWRLVDDPAPMVLLREQPLLAGQTSTLPPVAVDIYSTEDQYTGVIVAYDGAGGCYTQPVGGRDVIVDEDLPSVVWNIDRSIGGTLSSPCPYPLE